MYGRRCYAFEMATSATPRVSAVNTFAFASSKNAKLNALHGSEAGCAVDLKVRLRGRFWCFLLQIDCFQYRFVRLALFAVVEGSRLRFASLCFGYANHRESKTAASHRKAPAGVPGTALRVCLTGQGQRRSRVVVVTHFLHKCFIFSFR